MSVATHPLRRAAAPRRRSPAAHRRDRVGVARIAASVVVCLSTIVVAGGAAVAGPTGLTVIPTTDLVRFRQVNAILQNGNIQLDGRHAFFRDVQPAPQIEVGLPHDVEAGVDVTLADPPRDYRPFFNAKWTMLAEDYRVPAVAIGATQLGPGFTPAGFVVASKTLNYDEIAYQKFRAHHRNIRLHGIRAHAGFMQVGDRAHAMLGIDAELNEHFVLWSDWISGARNSLSLTAVVVIDSQNSFFIGFLKGNDEWRVGGVLFNVTHTFDY